MTNGFTKTVRDASEYHEMVRHANALGFEVVNASAAGGWETKDGEAVFLAGSDVEITNVGWKYFYIMVDGEELGVQPVSTFSKDAGTITLHFEEA